MPPTRCSPRTFFHRRSRLSLHKRESEAHPEKSARCPEEQPPKLKEAKNESRKFEDESGADTAVGQRAVGREDAKPGAIPGTGSSDSSDNDGSSRGGTADQGAEVLQNGDKRDPAANGRCKGDGEVSPPNGKRENRFPAKQRPSEATLADEDSANNQAQADNPPREENGTTHIDSTIHEDAQNMMTRQTGISPGNAPVPIKLPAKKGMDVDFGDDSGSSDDENGAEAAQSKGAAHLGQAMDGERDSPILARGTTGTHVSSTGARTRQAKPFDDPADDSPGFPGTPEADDFAQVQSTAAAQTPPRKQHQPGDTAGDNKDGAPKAEGSPNPSLSSMGLVDTPPPAPPAPSSTSGTGGSTRRKTTRKSPTPRKGSDVLASTGGECSVNQSATSPAASELKGGKWACTRCTLVNRARVKVCDACAMAKPTVSAGASCSATSIGSSSSRGSNPRKRKAASDHPSGDDGQSGTEGDAKRGGLGDLGDGTQGDCEARSREATKKSRAAAKSAGGDDDGRETGSGGDEGGRSRRFVSTSTTKNQKNDVEVLEGLNGFVGDIGAMTFDADDFGCGSDDCDDDDGERFDEDDDEDWKEDGGEDDDDDVEAGEGERDSEIIGSQIEKQLKRVLQQDCGRDNRSSPGAGPSREKRKRQAPPVAGEVLDLTEAAEDSPDELSGYGKSRRDGAGRPYGDDPLNNPRYIVEDISDDDDATVNPGFGGYWNPKAAGGGAGGDSSAPSQIRRYRFFASVEEHQDAGSSSIDFAKLLTPKGGTPSSTYETRRKSRDAKSAKGKKKGRKTAGGTAKARGATSAAIKNAVEVARRRGAAGGMPSAAWIPSRVGSAAVGSPGVGARRSSRAMAASGIPRSGVREPFNHYRGNDEVVENSGVGGGGTHWEGVGTATFGD